MCVAILLELTGHDLGWKTWKTWRVQKSPSRDRELVTTTRKQHLIGTRDVISNRGSHLLYLHVYKKHRHIKNHHAHLIPFGLSDSNGSTPSSNKIYLGYPLIALWRNISRTELS